MPKGLANITTTSTLTGFEPEDTVEDVLARVRRTLEDPDLNQSPLVEIRVKWDGEQITR